MPQPPSTALHKKPSPFDVQSSPLHDPEAAARWEALWTAAPERSPFTARAYAEAVTAALGLEATVYIITRDAQDVGGALVYGRRRGPFREAVIPPFTAFTSPLFAAPLREADVHAQTSPFDALLPALEADYDALRFHLDPTLLDVRCASWHGWQVRPLYTYRTPLAQAATLQSAWSSSTRRTFRKSAPGYDIVEDPQAAEAAARLSAASYERSQNAFHVEIPRLVEWINALQATGLVRIFTATPKGADTPEGAVAFLIDDRVAYYWVSGSTPGPAMTVLLGTAMPLLYADGRETFDWVGANTPTIAEFKRRFNPKLTPYYRLEKTPHRILRLYHALRGR